MEIAVKIAVYLTIGVALVACNVWYIRRVYQSMTGSHLVVAPVKVVGGTGDPALAGETRSHDHFLPRIQRWFTAKMAMLRDSRNQLRGLRRRSRRQTPSGGSLILRTAEAQNWEEDD
jgi:hypothetical protein